ncbi:Putative alkaline phosphatase, alkaline-phosphatase-like, core domain superfamily [Septoria linicola]|uniref:alkaline phosphatase n=1 Tax=Septoria linicola TaxID=215465 RepID=A0A9Q9AII8_9PEZI|nr:Putative alkaline phosphatase, alkaline-phosphatase-like, core domain superfamily [Septoria linicola]
MKSFTRLSAAAGLVSVVGAQTFRRFGTCPTLGCVIPPDQQDFLAGQYFDIRVEIHAPVNGSEATNGVPDEDFTFTISKDGGAPQPVTTYFELDEPEIETWDFSYFEDLFASDAGTPSAVNVASKAWRRVALYEPGEYTAVLTYNNGTNTTANWLVRDIEQVRKTKNILLFIGDGMTTNMVTAARLIGHKTVNGRYQSTLALDKFPTIGHQMTHSIDTFITDSANSATALYTGHKSVVNALGVYGDTSPDPFDDPKVETIAEIFHRLAGGHVGIVSTAFIADATPAALTAHTRERGEYGAVIDSFINGIVNYTWTEWNGPDVLFGGGAENFCSPELGGETYQDLDYYKVFADAGYNIVYNKTQLEATSSEERTLGIFSQSNMAKWLDRNVYTANLNTTESPTCNNGTAEDQPGLKEMTVKAIDILNNRAGDKGWFIMSEAASVDKMMHVLDYDRALAELLELDDTVKHSIEHLKEIDAYKDTLIVVTADHGHGFDVFGNVDTQYFNEQTDDRDKRSAIGVYERSGLSGYVNTGDLKYADSNFPSNWEPRYTLAQGFGAFPDHRENFQVNKNGPRTPARNISGFPSTDFFANPSDDQNGITINGTLPTSANQGVHSLTDVTVWAQGPCSELFGGVYNSIDVFFKMAECLGLSEKRGGGNGTAPGYGHTKKHEQKDNWEKCEGKKGYTRYDEKHPRYAGENAHGHNTGVKPRSAKPGHDYC